MMRSAEIMDVITTQDDEIRRQLEAAAVDPRLQSAVRLCGAYDRTHKEIGQQHVTIDEELDEVIRYFGIPESCISQLLNLCEVRLNEIQN